ncbi:phage small terminase subunit [Glaesserella parasuis 29755]|nr:phage small terminase subunit [Glaesserella parasuis 29755]CDH99094.1 phage small terminase subunit [Glaesserella parasuis 29755]
MRPTQAHYLRVTAELAQSSEQAQLENLDEYEKMLYLLARHKKDLKAIASMEQRASYKKSILHHYLPWIEGALSAGNGKQDNVLMTWQVWSVDCGEYHLALQIADYAIHQDLTFCLTALVVRFAQCLLKSLLTLRKKPRRCKSRLK